MMDGQRKESASIKINVPNNTCATDAMSSPRPPRGSELPPGDAEEKEAPHWMNR